MADEFEIVITRRKPNPKFDPKRSRSHYDEPVEPYLSERVTSATLNEYEWLTVQRALLAAIGLRVDPTVVEES